MPRAAGSRVKNSRPRMPGPVCEPRRPNFAPPHRRHAPLGVVDFSYPEAIPTSFVCLKELGGNTVSSIWINEHISHHVRGFDRLAI